MQRGERVLIADDSKVIRITLRQILQKLGVRSEDIVEAADGQAAVDVFEKEPPSIVFMDIEMPNMDGEQAAAFMLQANPLAKIIVVTAHDREDPRVRNLIAQGAFSVVRKPIRTEELQTVLRELDAETGYTGRIH